MALRFIAPPREKGEKTRGVRSCLNSKSFFILLNDEGKVGNSFAFEMHYALRKGIALFLIRRVVA